MQKNKKELQKIAKMLFKTSFSGDSLDHKKVLNVISGIKTRFGNLSRGILTYYLKMVKRNIGEHTIIIESAIPVERRQNDIIVSLFEYKLKKKLIVKNVLNPKILGGVKLSIGDNQYDYSVKDKLNKLKEVVSA